MRRFQNGGGRKGILARLLGLKSVIVLISSKDERRRKGRWFVKILLKNEAVRAPGTVEEIVMIKNWILAFSKSLDLENPGIDPGTSRMLSERSTIWANSPACYLWEIKFKNISFKFLRSDWLISLYARSIRFRQIFRSIRYRWFLVVFLRETHKLREDNFEFFCFVFHGTWPFAKDTGAFFNATWCRIALPCVTHLIECLSCKQTHLTRKECNISGLLAQSAERGADNAKVVSSTLTRTNTCLFF